MMVSDFSVLANVTPKQPALQLAIDTLSLAQIGTSFKSDRMLAESRQTYGRALQCLVATLGHSQSEACLDGEVLATITVLGFCEVRQSLQNRNTILT